VRKVVAEGRRADAANTGYTWDETILALGNHSLGEILLTPTRIYVEPVLKARQEGLAIHGMAHITGGGLPENLPRCLGPDQDIHLHVGSWPVPSVFGWLAEAGQVPAIDLYNTFNMGLGFALVVPPQESDRALVWLSEHQVEAYLVGEVTAGSGIVTGLPK
jgi:phosphoribosylformylglycinamidine cyclo-ligase